MGYCCRLLVDEYQDCNIAQHAIIACTSAIIPTVVFGDPLQSIFTFAGAMPSWNDDVESTLPLICELNEPWRWINAGTKYLGEWILHCREQLTQGHSIDLLSFPEYVYWNQLVGDARDDMQNQIKAQYNIRCYNANDSLLVIGNPYNSALRSVCKFCRG